VSLREARNITDKDPPEKPQEKRRHLVDCLAYILLDLPRFIDRRRARGYMAAYRQGDWLLSDRKGLGCVGIAVLSGTR